MALNSALITQGLIPMTTDYPESASDAAQKAADAYEAYAKLGQAQGLFPVLTGSEKGNIYVALMRVWNAPSSATAASVASAWYQGILQFWTSPPVLFPGPYGPGMAVVPPLSTVVPCISSISQPTQNGVPPIQRLAACLDSATRGVQVLVPQMPPATPLTFPLV